MGESGTKAAIMHHQEGIESKCQQEASEQEARHQQIEIECQQESDEQQANRRVCHVREGCQISEPDEGLEFKGVNKQSATSGDNFENTQQKQQYQQGPATESPQTQESSESMNACESNEQQNKQQQLEQHRQQYDKQQHKRQQQRQRNRQQSSVTPTASTITGASSVSSSEQQQQLQVPISADYLAQLIKDKKQLSAFPSVFNHVQRLLDEEINKVRQSLFQLSDVVHQQEPLDLPEPEGEFVTFQEKIYVPVDEHPDYNFVGRLLGPRGMTAKQLEQETGCKIMIRGRGSMRDKKKVCKDN